VSRNGKIPKVIKTRMRIKDAAEAEAGVKLARIGVGRVKVGVVAVEVTAEGARVECGNSAGDLRTGRRIWKPGESTKSR
jgi:hypothetical protein